MMTGTASKSVEASWRYALFTATPSPLIPFQHPYKIQQLFSASKTVSIYNAIPAFEKLLTQWENKRKDPDLAQYHAALDAGLEKLRKYYLKFDEKPAYILSLCTHPFPAGTTANILSSFLVIHPYYKLHWIELHWGGADAQQAEYEAGNFDAKDWVKEAKRVVEKKVRIFYFSSYITLKLILN